MENGSPVFHPLHGVSRQRTTPSAPSAPCRTSRCFVRGACREAERGSSRGRRSRKYHYHEQCTTERPTKGLERIASVKDEAVKCVRRLAVNIYVVSWWAVRSPYEVSSGTSRKGCVRGGDITYEVRSDEP